jgi:predicted MPP superfamily phosphohydrolase
LNRNSMETLASPDSTDIKCSVPSISRRRFLTTGLCACAGVAFYSGEIERHWIEVTPLEIRLRRLPAAFEGMKIAQLSDIHLDEFTEPFLLRDSVDRINRMRPDVVLLTGDFVTYELTSKRFCRKTAWECAEILSQLQCPERYAVLGNHDHWFNADEVTRALQAYGIPVLNNSHVGLDRRGTRIWLAGVDDPVCGRPDPGKAIPALLRDGEQPVILMCHGPDYADELRAQPAGQSVALMLSGHTHGGQVRLPFAGALQLPPGGRKYVEGLFRLGSMQLYVNRGIGTVGVPFRFDCPPEITSITLRSAGEEQA